MNDNSTPTGVANPNRTRIRTEADLRRGAQSATPDAERAPRDR